MSVFLPKIYGGGLDDVEKLRHDRRYSTEVAGARGRLGVIEATEVNVRRRKSALSLRVYLSIGWSEEEIDAGGGEPRYIRLGGVSIV